MGNLDRAVVSRTVGLVATAIVLVFLSAGSVQAKSWGYDLAGELMSPYCPGRTLASCPSPQAAELVQWMVLQEAAGSTQEEVIAILIERFGEEILGAPPAKGITIWAYIFPILGFVVGGGFVVIAMRRIVAGNDAVDYAGNISTSTSTTALAAVGPSGVEGAVNRDQGSQEMSPEMADDELARLVDEDLAARG